MNPRFISGNYEAIIEKPKPRISEELNCPECESDRVDERLNHFSCTICGESWNTKSKAVNG